MGNARIPTHPLQRKVPSGKFSGKNTCGKTTADNEKQHQEVLLVAADGGEILKMLELDAGCRVTEEEKALEFTTLKSITMGSIVTPQNLQTFAYENL
jgi:hypothetical protein